MDFSYSGNLAVRCAIVEAETVLANWEYLATAPQNTVELTPAPNDCQYAANVVVTYTCGLCSSVFHRLDAKDRLMIFEAWPHYSGQSSYPVGGAYEYDGKGDSFGDQPYFHNKYQNPKRKALLEFALVHLKKYLEA